MSENVIPVNFCWFIVDKIACLLTSGTLVTPSGAQPRGHPCPCASGTERHEVGTTVIVDGLACTVCAVAILLVM
jgi:hypothetical protein